MFPRFSSAEALTREHAETLVRMLYEGVFKREVDPDGLAHFSRQLRAGGDLGEMLRTLLASDEFLARFRQAHPVAAPTDDPSELVRRLYRGLLGREADVTGLKHHVESLRSHGELEAVLRSFIGSDEFLLQFKENNPARAGAIEAALPEPHKKIHIYSNCQGNNLGRCIQALTGAKSPAFHFYYGTDPAEPRRAGTAVLKALEAVDVVLMQPLVAQGIGEIFPELLSHEKIVLFPAISFAAYQPDLCYVFRKGSFDEIPAPLGPYHSSIAYHAWRNGRSSGQALALYREDVYQQLRFFDYWDSARLALVEEGQRAGIPLEGLLEKWRAQGCFMHTPNHPKLSVSIDIARRVLQKLDIPTFSVDPQQMVWDNLADCPIWPVYPEIAARYGCEGSTVFKGNNLGLPGKTPVALYPLEEFVERSFAAFEQYGREPGIWCNRPYTERYRQLFELRPGASSSIPVSATKPQAANTGIEVAAVRNPYAQLSAAQVWRKAVSGLPPSEIDLVSSAPFQINRRTAVTTAGSCFAQHISRQLRRRGFNCLLTEPAPAALSAAEAQHRNFAVYGARYGNIYTARQLLQLLRRARGEFAPAEAAWQRSDGRWADPFRPEIEPAGFASLADLDAARVQHLKAVCQLFESVETFIFTLGLTEAWRSREDGAVFPLAPGVVAGDFDPSRHEFVNFGVAEVLGDLEAFIQELRAINPAVRLLLTVSPVPLAASYEQQHVMVSTSYSKSVLRVAAEALVRAQPDCAYFPSYEIITGHFNRGAYFEKDLRAVNAAGVDHVMRLFFAHYAPEGLSLPADDELLAEAEDNFRIVCEEERLAAAGF